MLHFNTCILTSLGAYSLLDDRDHNAVKHLKSSAHIQSCPAHKLYVFPILHFTKSFNLGLLNCC